MVQCDMNNTEVYSHKNIRHFDGTDDCNDLSPDWMLRYNLCIYLIVVAAL